MKTALKKNLKSKLQLKISLNAEAKDQATFQDKLAETSLLAPHLYLLNKDHTKMLLILQQVLEPFHHALEPIVTFQRLTAQTELDQSAMAKVLMVLKELAAELRDQFAMDIQETMVTQELTAHQNHSQPAMRKLVGKLEEIVKLDHQEPQ